MGRRTISSIVAEIRGLNPPKEVMELVEEMENYHGGYISNLKENIFESAKIESEEIEGREDTYISMKNLESILLNI